MKRLQAIEKLNKALFSGRWASLHGSDALGNDALKFPGVYLLAYTARRLDGCRISVDDIFYVGMSNSAGGVRQRLKQFKGGIEVNNYHSGAMRFFREHGKGKAFSESKSRKRLYFAALTLPCASSKADALPADFREFGHIGCLECYAVAYVFEKTKKLPALNGYIRVKV